MWRKFRRNICDIYSIYTICIYRATCIRGTLEDRIIVSVCDRNEGRQGDFIILMKTSALTSTREGRGRRAELIKTQFVGGVSRRASRNDEGFQVFNAGLMVVVCARVEKSVCPERYTISIYAMHGVGYMRNGLI